MLANSLLLNPHWQGYSANPRNTAQNAMRWLQFPLVFIISFWAITTFGPACNAQTGAWITHNDSAGFTVTYPNNWRVETGSDKHVMVRSADGRAFVYARPFRAPSGVSSAACLQHMVAQLSNVFTAGKVVRLESVSGGVPGALARVQFGPAGGPSLASVLVYVSGLHGMLYTIAAPTSEFASSRSRLIKVLQSLRNTTHGNAGPDGSPTRRHGSSLGAISYVTWRDPQEGAFTVQVPRGWKVTGGLYRYAPIDVRIQLDLGSPDGSIHIQAGDARLGSFAPPGPSSQVRGLHNGQTYVVNGVPYVVMPPEDGATFSRRYVQETRAKLSGFEMGESRDRPDLVNALDPHGKAQGHASVGETDFTYLKGGRRLQGVCVTRTLVNGEGLSMLWTAEPEVITGGSAAIPVGMKILLHLAQTVAADAQWSARSQESVRAFSKMVMEHHQRAMAEMNQVYNKFVQRLNENARVWSNVMTNQEDVRNTTTGETFKAEAGHVYYWQSAGGVTGSDTNRAPGVSFAPLEKF